jgi:hypothetical protein
MGTWNSFFWDLAARAWSRPLSSIWLCGEKWWSYTFSPTIKHKGNFTFFILYSSTALRNSATFSLSYSYAVGRTPWTRDQLVTRSLTTQTQNKRTQTYMPQVRFELMALEFEAGEYGSCLRSRAHCGWYFYVLPYIILINIVVRNSKDTLAICSFWSRHQIIAYRDYIACEPLKGLEGFHVQISVFVTRQAIHRYYLKTGSNFFSVRELHYLTSPWKEHQSLTV